MASSSFSADFPSSSYCSSTFTSKQVQPRKYGVFLNFRGKDTREGFVSFLHRHIKERGIDAYLDSEDLEKGADISTIEDAIRDSNIAVVVFSREYASSSYCLNELVKIMEYKQTTGLEVLVVFYRVNPEEVENQTGSFSREFDNHRQSYDEQTIAKWRTALKNAASVSGWDYNSKGIRNEFDLVDKIVEDISEKLTHIYLTNDFSGLVGMPLRVKEVESLLCFEEENVVRIVGIWGMGGIGKTTLARAIFDKYSSLFHRVHFLEGVRNELEKKTLPMLKDELYASLLNGAKFSSSNPIFLRNKLKNQKDLIVLDDVDKPEQIESLAGKHEWFGDGSRIIITSRDKQVLNNGNVDATYGVQQLDRHKALMLFSLFAFKQSYPLADFLELSNRVLEYAKGLPLALKVLGNFLQGKDKKVFEDALNQLQNIAREDVQEVLKISYSGLYSDAKEIFLHIACFFRGEDKTEVERILESCGFSATIGLSTLVDKALIVISNNNKVEMHDLLEEMGREIVRQESVKDPGKRSRLWDPEGIRHVLIKNKGTSAIEGISAAMSELGPLEDVDPTAFSKLDEVKFLRIYDFGFRFYGGLESFPEKLRYLEWHGYPFIDWPPNDNFENLVELHIVHGQIERLWTGKQNLPSLRMMSLRACGHLIEMPDFSRTPKLQFISFYSCHNLREVSPSIEYLKNLEELRLESCSKIESIPSTKGLRSLKILALISCSALKKLSELSESIEELYLCGTRKEEETDYFMSRANCLSGLQQVQDLSPFFLEIYLGRLQKLNLSSSSFENIGSIKRLSCLETLYIAECTSLQSLPELPPHLKYLAASHCTALKMVTSSKFALAETSKELRDFKVRFVFVNCHQLNEDARRNVFSHARQIIRLYAQKALYQLPKDVGRKGDVSFIYHGNEIPDWIDRQSTGSSITLELPRDLSDDRKFLGFVLCAKYAAFTNIDVECLFESNDGSRNTIFIEGTPTTIRSSGTKGAHVVVRYSIRLHSAIVGSLGGEDYYKRATFQFLVHGDEGWYKGWNKVTKCGVRLLYIDEETRKRKRS